MDDDDEGVVNDDGDGDVDLVMTCKLLLYHHEWKIFLLLLLLHDVLEMMPLDHLDQDGLLQQLNDIEAIQELIVDVAIVVFVQVLQQ